MKKAEYGVFEALNPFFEIVLTGLSGLVDGEHYFDTIADSAIFESRYHFPGWPVTIQRRANLMASLSGYGKTIKLHSGHALVGVRRQKKGTPTVQRSTEHTKTRTNTGYFAPGNSPRASKRLG